MNLARISTVLALALFLAAKPAYAADFNVVDSKDSSTPIIVIEGEIQNGDDAKFRTIAAQHSEAIVILNSNGGSIAPAMDIGRTIRLREYTTAVYKGDVCASACALIWIAGERRAIFDGGEVGFHASYLDEDGKAIETGLGNALVGHYLSQLGFGEKTVIFATAAPPDKILWLNIQSASLAGIDYDSIPLEEQTAHDANIGASTPRTTTASSANQNESSNRNRNKTNLVEPREPWLGKASQTFTDVQSFAEGLRKQGFQAEVDISDSNGPSIITGVNGDKIMISFSSCSDGDCKYLEVLALWSGVDYASANHLIQEWTKEENFSSVVYIEKSESLGVYHYLVVGKEGITIQNLIDDINYVDSDFANIGKMIVNKS